MRDILKLSSQKSFNYIVIKPFLLCVENPAFVLQICNIVKKMLFKNLSRAELLY